MFFFTIFCMTDDVFPTYIGTIFIKYTTLYHMAPNVAFQDHIQVFKNVSNVQRYVSSTIYLL